MPASPKAEDGFFQRYTAADFSELEQQITQRSAALAAAQAQRDRDRLGAKSVGVDEAPFA